jgi:endogenous inhibitor of DNA gyrase (YacG/DUF329 family)
MNEAEKSSGTRRARAKGTGCPICGNPRDLDYRPFCSKRCADVDLGRWLTGRYAIPVTEDSDEDGGDTSTHTPDDSAAARLDRGAGSD